MEFDPFSHRNSKVRFVRIDFKHRDTGSRAIVTCSKNEIERHAVAYQARGYELVNVKAT